MSKITVGYWNIRALAEPIRLMLEYCGADYDNKSYVVLGEPPNVDKSQWFDVKYELGLVFPNLPYLIDGDVKMTKSWAIMSYVARKFGKLVPKSEEETQRCDMVKEAYIDMWFTIKRMLFSSDGREVAMTNLLANDLPEYLCTFEKFLSDKDWMAGATLTYVDFEICERLDVLEEMKSDCLDKYPNVKKYKERFFALDKIAVYRRSERFKEYPIFNIYTNWGYKKEN